MYKLFAAALLLAQPCAQQYKYIPVQKAAPTIQFGIVAKTSRLKPLPQSNLALWENFAAKAAPTMLVRNVVAAFYTGCIYVAEHMDVRERPAANNLYIGAPHRCINELLMIRPRAT